MKPKLLCLTSIYLSLVTSLGGSVETAQAQNRNAYSINSNSVSMMLRDPAQNNRNECSRMCEFLNDLNTLGNGISIAVVQVISIEKTVGLNPNSIADLSGTGRSETNAARFKVLETIIGPVLPKHLTCVDQVQSSNVLSPTCGIMAGDIIAVGIAPGKMPNIVGHDIRSLLYGSKDPFVADLRRVAEWRKLSNREHSLTEIRSAILSQATNERSRVAAMVTWMDLNIQVDNPFFASTPSYKSARSILPELLSQTPIPPNLLVLAMNYVRGNLLTEMGAGSDLSKIVRCLLAVYENCADRRVALDAGIRLDYLVTHPDDFNSLRKYVEFPYFKDIVVRISENEKLTSSTYQIASHIRDAMAARRRNWETTVPKPKLYNVILPVEVSK